MVEMTTAPEKEAKQAEVAPAKPQSTWARWREYLIHHAPAPIVNNASNVVGATQLVAEVFLYKAGNNDLMTTKAGERNLWHYIIEPPKNIVGAALKKAGSNTKFSDYLKPSFYWDGMKRLNDMEGATLRDSLNHTVKLTNRWSARSGLTGITSMTVATLLPDRKESQEETDRMANMAHDTPVRYVGHRLAQAINPLEWWNNKRQFAGAGMLATGFFSFLSGFRQIEGEFGKELQLYRRNYWQMAGGLITTFAGGQLLLAINNQQGWTRYGTTQLARLLTLPGSIWERYRKSERGLAEQGAGWYFGGQGLMVVKNSTSSLLGGADVKINADGTRTVTDHAAMKKEAIEKAKIDNNDARGLQPSPQVSKISRERAMPDLEQAQLQGAQV